MKKITIALFSLFVIPAVAQDHFGPISTSKRVGILNGNMNPSEFANLGSRFEVQLIGVSLNASNSRLSFSDFGEDNVEELLFSGNEGVDFAGDLDLALPGVAFKALGFGFALTSTAHVRANVNDIDPALGRALTSDTFDPVGSAAILNYGGNQRMNGTVWGEIGLSVARKLWENEKHRFNAGVTFKLLFPGSYGNVGLSNLQGQLSSNANGDIILNNPQGMLNIAYSGSLGENYDDSDNYTKSLFGGLNGFAGDIGLDYQLKTDTGYKLKVGASIKNMGSMTFKDSGNKSTNYALTGNDINLEAFSDVDGVEDIEQQLINQGAINITNGETDFKVKLPTVFNLYADVKVISKLNLTVFLQQKMNDNSGNDQITAQNLFSVTPRIGLGFFEAFLPITVAEISGTNAGLGFRLAGFYLGSNSVFTAIGSGKQGDAYIGYRFGFL